MFFDPLPSFANRQSTLQQMDLFTGVELHFVVYPSFHIFHFLGLAPQKS
jgi:hypothetical protein